MVGQFLYALDAPATFQRDQKAGDVGLADIKVSEIAVISPDRLVILERISRTTKIYQVTLSPRYDVPAAHMGSGPARHLNNRVPLQCNRMIFRSLRSHWCSRQMMRRRWIAIWRDLSCSRRTNFSSSLTTISGSRARARGFGASNSQYRLHRPPAS